MIALDPEPQAVTPGIFAACPFQDQGYKRADVLPAGTASF